MPLSGKALAEAHVKVRADMSSVAGDVRDGTDKAIRGAAGPAGRSLKDAIVRPLKEGFAEGVKAADPGGQAVGGKLRQGLATKLRGVAADAQKAGVDAGTGINRGVSTKMREVADTTGKGGKAAGERFSKETGKAVEEKGSYLHRAGKSTAEELVKPFLAAEVGMKAIDIFGEFISGARDAEKATRLTDQVIETTGGVARVTATDVEDLARSISNKTGVDDDAIHSGENLLLTFTGIRNEVGKGNDIFNQATATVTDMSVALGQDMKSSAIQVGKALNDPIKGVSALQRVGVSFTASQKDQIKTLVQTGNVMGAQKVILAELGKEFGGAAAAAATPMDRLRVTVDNLGKETAGRLLPVIDKVATVLANNVVPALGSAIDWLAKIPAPFYEAAAGAAALYGAFKIGKSVFDGVSGAVKTLGTAMEWMGLRTAAAATAEGVQAAAAEAQAAATDTAAAATTRLGGAMGLLAKGGGIVALAAISTQLQEAAGSLTTAKVPTDALTQSLLQLGKTGQISGAGLDVFKQGWGPFSQDVHNSSDAIARFGDLAKGAIGGANESFTEMVGRLADGGSRMGTLKSITEQYDKSLAAMVQGGSVAEAKSAFGTLAKAATDQGVSLDEINKLFPAYTAAAAAAATSATSTAGAVRAGAEATRAAAGAQAASTVTLGDLTKVYPKYRDVILAAVGASTAAAGENAVLSSSQLKAANSAVRHQQALDALTGSLNANNNAVLQLSGGEAGYYAALDAATKAVKTNGRGLDVHTEKGRTNRAALDALAAAGLNYLGVIQQNNGVGPKFRRTLDQQWQKLYDAAVRFGATKKEARLYADQILATPKALATKVTQPGMSAAQQAVKNLHKAMDGLTNRALKITVNADGTFTQGTKKGRAMGGPIDGWSPTPTADNVPIAATAGEHMWSVAEVQGAGGHGNVERLRMAARTGTLPKFAAGGAIQLRGSTRLPSAATLDAVIDADMMAAFKAAYAASSSAGGGGGGGGPSSGSPGGNAHNKAIGRAMAAARGWTGGQWNALDRLWMGESGWNQYADNPSSDAYGIPQSLPGSKMASAGSDWRTNPATQIRWGLGYIAGAYGSPANAYSKWLARAPHWYGAGTKRALPGWAWTGEHGPELVRFQGGEQVKTAAASRAAESGDDRVRLHPDTVAALGAAFAAAAARQQIILDGRTVAGYVDRALGRSALSVRG